MCGIAGIHRLDNERPEALGKLMDNLLWGILPRGTDATGVMSMLDNGKVQLERRTVPAATFIRGRKLVSDQSRTVLLHTRFATVGRADDPRNAHPVINGTCAAIHNGTIYNHADLFRSFGLRRHAQVDSEIIPALVSYAGWGSAGEALALMSGGAATAIVSNEHPRDLILARTRSYPLHWMQLRGLMVWASTEHAIRKAWQATYGQDPWKAKGVRHGSLAEYTMIRHQDGKLYAAHIPWKGTEKPATQPQERSSAPATPKRGTRVGASKKQRKRAQKKTAKRQGTQSGNRRPRASTQLTLPGHGTLAETVTSHVPRNPYRSPHLDPEPWMEETVTDLMRTYDLDYESAYEAVFGVAPMSDDDWLQSFGV